MLSIYKNVEEKYLPNIICFLNRGIIVKSRIENNKPAAIELFPEFIPSENLVDYKWVFLELGEDGDNGSPHLAYIYFALNAHLRNCLVLRPDLANYLGKMWNFKKGQIMNL